MLKIIPWTLFAKDYIRISYMVTYYVKHKRFISGNNIRYTHYNIREARHGLIQTNYTSDLYKGTRDSYESHIWKSYKRFTMCDHIRISYEGIISEISDSYQRIKSLTSCIIQGISLQHLNLPQARLGSRSLCTWDCLLCLTI